MPKIAIDLDEASEAPLSKHDLATLPHRWQSFAARWA
jgi:hypothetical protein